ncbi:hypothetical protein FJTKL_02709 [Diaporthe vaccinii]|uniref:BTB domain-containing protein n=1 Tax=Diaporthe vaccinii TaxID=105482 RepID=A0ABR4DWR4_9PEZI
MEVAEDCRVVNLSSLLTSGKFSDLRLVCESREFSVHKAILCSQSRVFNSACEGNFEESRSNVIKIEEFKADTVQRMLEFLYSGDYSVSQRADWSSGDAERIDDESSEYDVLTQSLASNEFGSNKPAVAKKDILCWHLNANAIGDYYDIKPLCTLARSKVETAVEADWSPDDFLHLLTETCTTRKTGDVEFHRLLGQIISKRLEDLAGLQDLDGLDMPADIATSVVVSSMERVRSLETKCMSE